METKDTLTLYLAATLLTLLNLAFWLSILLGLPGTWLMVLVPALVEWWQPGTYLFGWGVLVVCAGLAALGEVFEFVLGAAGSRKAGGSKRAAALAIAGGFVGGIVGTGVIPVPVVGTLVGACLGAFAGSLLGDLWAGRPLAQGLRAGRGAASGRLWGTVAKFAIGGVIFAAITVAAFF